jgi:hypothetical protein
LGQQISKLRSPQIRRTFLNGLDDLSATAFERVTDVQHRNSNAALDEGERTKRRRQPRPDHDRVGHDITPLTES